MGLVTDVPCDVRCVIGNVEFFQGSGPIFVHDLKILFHAQNFLPKCEINIFIACIGSFIIIPRPPTLQFLSYVYSI